MVINKEDMLPENYSYTPFPSDIVLKDSEIHGRGIFAASYIMATSIVGLSHYSTKKQLIRTPLGAFINHSSSPNCVVSKKGKRWYLVTTRFIEEGEELTLNYHNYDCSNRS